MLTLLIVCVAITLLTLEILIVSHFHAYYHRLLVLVLGLVCVYDFYLLVEYITGATEVFLLLKDLLLIQMLDLMIYYVADFMSVKIKMPMNIAIISILILLDIYIVISFANGKSNRLVFTLFSICAAAIIVLVPMLALVRKRYSPITHRNHRIVFIALIIPAIALVFSMFKIIPEAIAMPISLAIGCMLLDYLFITDRLRDVSSILKEELFQTLDAPTILYDPEFCYIDAGRSAKELFGSVISELESNPVNHPFKDNLRELLSSDSGYELENDGRYYNLTIHKAYYKNKMRGYVMMFNDVTLQKNEAKLAKQLADDKSNFLASMSHDLRSPLHAIIGGSEIILSRNSEMSPRNSVMVENIHTAGENLLSMVNSILEFSKLQSGSLDLTTKDYSFKSLLENQATYALLNLKDKDVEFTLAVTTPFPESVHGDVMRVRQIIQNLLSNAIKFTDSGSIHAELSVRIIDAVSEASRIKYEITYKVTDTGIGMTEDQIANIFDGYVSYAASVNKEGTGLGLSIVKQLAEAMEGTAFAESDGHSGSTFTVVFTQLECGKGCSSLHDPLVITDYIGSAEHATVTDVVLPSYTYPSAEILLTDDMAVNREIFSEMAAPWKAKITLANDGTEAVAEVRKMLDQGKHFDLIFLDQMMPEMSGMEAGDIIREMSDSPMILMTANIAEDVRIESTHHGFTDFIPKPLTMNVLKKTLEFYLPASKQKMPSNYGAPDQAARQTEIYYKSLSIYIEELKSLVEPLRQYAAEDLNMFRNKTHGIKGTSRQLGKERIAVIAEVMEMAAKTENQTFINKYIDMLMSDIVFTINSSEKELSELYKKLYESNPDFGRDSSKETDEASLSVVDAEVIRENFINLNQALSSYEMTDIEDSIDTLKTIKLSTEDRDLLNQVIKLYDDVEYDEAAELISARYPS